MADKQDATLGAKPEAPDGEWPQEGLETLGACPVCGCEARETLHEGLRDRIFFCAPGRWNLHRCGGCGVAYLDPRPTPETIGLAYRSYYTHKAAASRLAGGELSRAARLRRALRNGYLNRRYGYHYRPATALGPLAMRLFPTQRVAADIWVRGLPLPPAAPRLLDVGCGNAVFLKDMRDAGWQVTGLDPDPEAVAAAAEAGVEVRRGVLEAGAFPDNHFDAVTMSHVIEHLHDPAAALRRCREFLKPGGRLWIATPNVNCSSHEEFGAAWRGLEPPRHLVLFDPRSLRALLERTGFRVCGPPVATMNAEVYYRSSSAIARGLDPSGPIPELSPEQRERVRSVERATRRRPELSQELMMTARKPEES